jgi:DNA-binding CsgD family transcriptional regulator
MLKGNSVIIHPSLIIQLGLKDILLSKGIGISGIMQFCPETDIIRGWKDLLILTDANLYLDFKDHARTLRRNGNTLIGIEPALDIRQYDGIINNFLLLNDNLDAFNHLAEDYLNRISPLKSDSQLSSREIEVLTLVARGLSNKVIADQLFISIHTVITHRKNITFKLGIKSIPGLTLYASLNNLV